MPTFAAHLKTLPPVTAIDRIELRDGSDKLVATIENKPGQQGSLAVYHHLQSGTGRIDPAAARRGLELYAEHTADARAHPGKHPNIDRLLALVDSGGALHVRVIGRTTA